MSGVMGFISQGCCCSDAPYLYHPFLKGYSCGAIATIGHDWTTIHLQGEYLDYCGNPCPANYGPSALTCADVTVDNFNYEINCTVPPCNFGLGSVFNNLALENGFAETVTFQLCALTASSYGTHGFFNVDYCDPIFGNDAGCDGCEVPSCKSPICGGEDNCDCEDPYTISIGAAYKRNCLQRGPLGEADVCNCDATADPTGYGIGRSSETGLQVLKWGAAFNELPDYLEAASTYASNNPVVENALVIEVHPNQPAGCVMDCRMILTYQEVIRTGEFLPLQSDLELYPYLYLYFYDVAPCLFGNGSGTASCMYKPDRDVFGACNGDGFSLYSDPPFFDPCGAKPIATDERAPKYWAEIKVNIIVPAHGVHPQINYDFAWRGYGTPKHFHEWAAYYVKDVDGLPLIIDQRDTDDQPSEHWMGLRVPQSCLNKVTGKYTKLTGDNDDLDGLAQVGPKYLCDSIQVSNFADPCDEEIKIYIPDNSDAFRQTSRSSTKFVWSGQYRYGYGFNMCYNQFDQIGGNAQMLTIDCPTQGAPCPAPPIGSGLNNCNTAAQCNNKVGLEGTCAWDFGQYPATTVTTPLNGQWPYCSNCGGGVYPPCERTTLLSYQRGGPENQCQASFQLNSPFIWSKHNVPFGEGDDNEWILYPQMYGGCASSSGCSSSYCISVGGPHCALYCEGQQGGIMPKWSIVGG